MPAGPKWGSRDYDLPRRIREYTFRGSVNQAVGGVVNGTNNPGPGGFDLVIPELPGNAVILYWELRCLETSGATLELREGPEPAAGGALAPLFRSQDVNSLGTFDTLRPGMAYSYPGRPDLAKIDTKDDRISVVLLRSAVAAVDAEFVGRVQAWIPR